MRFVPLLWLCLAAICLAQEAVVQQTLFEGRPALILSNDKLELTIFTHGGAFANLTLRDDPEKLSPLWNSVRMAQAGGPKHSRFSFGHFICVDGFGPASPEELSAGFPGFGEARALPWAVAFSGKEENIRSLTFSVKLPFVQELLTRTHRIVDGENVIYVETEIENLLAYDRPLCWAEHVTLGPPFLEPGVTVVDMSAHQARTGAHELTPGALPDRFASFRDFTWPMAPGVDGNKIDVCVVPLKPNSSDLTTSLMDPSRSLVFVTALHPVKRLVLGYVFKPDEFPWLQNWEYYPPNPKTMARGLEFSTQPFAVGRREAIQTHSMLGAPTYRWLPARSKISSHFLMFYARTPEGFQKVDDVRLEAGTLTVEDHQAAKKITLAASLPL